MSEQLDRKLKVALDESRLLILGAQVLFGFTFQSVFQEQFQHLARESRLGHCSPLAVLLATVSLLIAPSLYHRLIYRGESRREALAMATLFAGVSLLPLTLGLGASAYVVFSHLFGARIGAVCGLTFAGVSLFLLYGLGFMMRAFGRRSARMPEEQEETPLATKIDQLLTEARVIIPGGQALLGFQLIATLTTAFTELPDTAKYVHIAALC